jgi:putative glutamine amidotransferase
VRQVSLHEVMPAHADDGREPRARVAVLVSLNFPDMTDETAGLVRRFTRVALASLRDLDVDVELIDTSTPVDAVARVAGCDGLFLLGGGDIDPTCYGDRGPLPPHTYGIDARADRDALDAIGAAEEAGLPVLGICRGAQLVNVHRGGTIVGDLEDFRLHRGGPGEPMFLDEVVAVVPGSRLRDHLGVDRLTVRSGHHQAVDRVGAGLVVAATALDGVVEAVEDPDRWVVGVQWHPEDDDGPAGDRHRLLDAFVAACEGRRVEPAAVPSPDPSAVDRVGSTP